MKAAVIAQAPMPGRERLAQKLEQCGLARAVVEALLSRHTLVRYPRGAIVFAQGAPADLIFAVFGGVLTLSRSAGPNRRVIVGLAGPGDLAGFAHGRDPHGNRSQLFGAEALTNATVAIITHEHLTETLRRLSAAALMGLCEELNSIWAAAFARGAEMLAMSLRQRLAAMLAGFADRFGIPESRGLILPLELGQQEIAEMIGGSRPMVGKLLVDLERDGFILRDGRRWIIGPRGGTDQSNVSSLAPPPPLAGLAAVR